MNRGDTPAGAETAAEAAELRKAAADRPKVKARRGLTAGQVKGRNCGRTAEEVRKIIDPLLSVLPARPPSLVLGPLPKPREGLPAAPPELRPAERAAAGGRAHSITRRGRAWAVHDPAGELVALVLYRKGAAEVVRRLDAGPGPSAVEGVGA